MLRRIFGQVVEQVMWRIRTAQEFRELCKDIDIVADIKGKRLECIENLVRMDHGMAIKRMFESKPEGERELKGPRLRWLEDEG
jgi:hypothetical protein